MPRNSRAWRGAEALWVTAAGWAGAAEQHYGSSWIGTSDTVAKAEDVLHYPLGSTTVVNTDKKGKYPWLPMVFKTLLKDILLKRSQPKEWAIEKDGPWKDETVKMVWEQHDLFPGPGYKIAKKLKVPFVLYVHGPAVWEASKWGVKRPVWGNWLEKNIEAASLKRADLVACVTEEVRQKLIDMGVQEHKTLVSPMSVDNKLFYPGKDVQHLKKELKIEHKTVIGWTGSFRSFHGLDTVVKAFLKIHKNHPDTVLILVGDGSEKEHIERLVHKMELQHVVLFPGRKPFAEIPDYVACFDIALVSAKTAEGFHYSPIKLREYMAAGKAAIAPLAGDLPLQFTEGEQVLFYEAGNEEHLESRLQLLINDVPFRNALGRNANEFVTSSSTWLHELKKVIAKLEANTL